MSELIVAKAGGTSNKDADAFLQSMNWAEQSDIFVCSAPGELGDSSEPDALKVTDMLIEARQKYRTTGAVPGELADRITGRYSAIINDLGKIPLPINWVDKITTRVEEAVRYGDDAASMLGERLQAEIYEAHGYTFLDPGQAPHDLGNDPEAWRGWLENVFEPGRKYILPGNTTLVAGQLKTFSRGGSDISGGLAAYGIRASKNLNLTDGPAMSADPRLIPAGRLRHIDHLLYEEGRELGRNGTGLVHSEAMVPLMLGNIPTEVRNTTEPAAPFTLLDNDRARAEKRFGRVLAVSLMENVTIHRVYEPGMAEPVGRLAVFENALAKAGVPLIDSQGCGVDGQKYFVEACKSEKAADGLRRVIKRGDIYTHENVALITLVGFNIGQRLIDNVISVVFSSGIDAKKWQTKEHDISPGIHSLRLSVDLEEALDVLDNVHHAFIEQHPEK